MVEELELGHVLRVTARGVAEFGIELEGGEADEHAHDVGILDPDALILGDTNSGRPLLDEENAVFDARYTEWFDSLERLEWADAFRYMCGDKREFTWYSPNKGNGFRLDQVFMSPSMTERVRHFEHRWVGEGRRDAVSDHAAMIVEFDRAPS